MKKRFLIALAASLLATTFSGCANRKESLLDPVLKVEQPIDCERVLQKVREPGLREGKDFRAEWYRMRGSLRIANTTIKNGRECVENQRQLYGGRPDGR